MDTEANQALLQSHQQEQEFELPNENEGLITNIRTQMNESIDNLKHLKSIEILKSALVIFTSSSKYMLFMILSIIPFFVFMVFYEMKLQQAMKLVARVLANMSYSSYDYSGYTYDDPVDYVSSNPYHILLELSSLYLVLYPLLELFCLIIVIKLAAKLYQGEKLDEVIFSMSNLKGPFITSLWVHFLSISTLFGLLWISANHFIISGGFNYYSYQPVETSNILSKGFHMLVFTALLYKYLDWSALWNMGIVISVLEGETGTEALDMSAYIGKHCQQTGLEIMLVFFASGVVLRLPYLFASSGVFVTAIVVGLLCLGNLVKWVALVLYFYECKAQTLLKKVDEDVGKAMKVADYC